MTKTLIVPGLDGSPAPHWQHWWAATDPRAHMVELSNPSHPDPDLWEVELASMILLHPDSVLVGHSLGSILAVRMMAHWPHLKVRAAVLVAPAETSGSSRIGRFGPIPEVRLDVPTTVVASRNDPWMSLARSAQLARTWGSNLVDLGRAGHINVESGYGPWALGKMLRDEIVARPASGQVARIAV